MLKLGPVASDVKVPPPSDVIRRNHRPRSIGNGLFSSDSTKKYAGLLKSALAAPKPKANPRESILICVGIEMHRSEEVGLVGCISLHISLLGASFLCECSYGQKGIDVDAA